MVAGRGNCWRRPARRIPSTPWSWPMPWRRAEPMSSPETARISSVSRRRTRKSGSIRSDRRVFLPAAPSECVFSRQECVCIRREIDLPGQGRTIPRQGDVLPGQGDRSPGSSWGMDLAEIVITCGGRESLLPRKVYARQKNVYEAGEQVLHGAGDVFPGQGIVFPAPGRPIPWPGRTSTGPGERKAGARKTRPGSRTRAARLWYAWFVRNRPPRLVRTRLGPLTGALVTCGELLGGGSCWDRRRVGGRGGLDGGRRGGRGRRGGWRRSRTAAALLGAGIPAGLEAVGDQLVVLEAELPLEDGGDPAVQLLAGLFRRTAQLDRVPELGERVPLLALQRPGLGDEGFQLLLLRRQLRHVLDQRLQGAVEQVPTGDPFVEHDGHFASLSFWAPRSPVQPRRLILRAMSKSRTVMPPAAGVVSLHSTVPLWSVTIGWCSSWPARVRTKPAKASGAPVSAKRKVRTSERPSRDCRQLGSLRNPSCTRSGFNRLVTGERARFSLDFTSTFGAELILSSAFPRARRMSTGAESLGGGVKNRKTRGTVARHGQACQLPGDKKQCGMP